MPNLIRDVISYMLEGAYSKICVNFKIVTKQFLNYVIV